MWWPFLSFIIILFFYHVTEFCLQWHYNPSLLSRDSFLFSMEYTAYMVLSVSEFCLEAWLFPSFKDFILGLAYVGSIIVVFGFFIRVLAIVTAAHSFTHDIQIARRDKHVLVDWGIYRYERHPGYVGWFVWAVGTQILLANPISLIAFAVVAWRFFADRIPYEEDTLMDIFGKEYAAYKKRVPTLFKF